MAILFRNFEAANRLKNLKDFCLIPNDYDLSWIASNDDSALVTPSGTIDGINAIFTIPGTIGVAFQVQKNGITQLVNVMYTFSGNTITFLDPYIPQTGDYIQVVVG